jgi:calcineurin-like phosphoesterase family protein
MNIYFTSDQHYGHRNIIKYCNRPFSSVSEMDEALVSNYSARVKPGDAVYFLGDTLFGDDDYGDSILSRLKGNKYLIFGNHDKLLRKSPLTKKYFVWARDYSEIKVHDQHIVLAHYSMRVWNRSHHGAWQLYGHSHGTLFDDPNLLSMDVGVDPNRFTPISFDEVASRMARKTFKPLDHHGAD